VIASDDSLYGDWVNGEAFTTNGALMFKAEQTFKGNSMGDVIYLSVPPESANVLPLLIQLAEKHQKLRLYGKLQWVSDADSKIKAPTLTLTISKIHDPDEPDELPENDKIIIKPDDTIKGDRIYKNTN
jgi:Tfp pilus assembly protein PilZ